MRSIRLALVVVIMTAFWGMSAAADQRSLDLSLGAGERFNDNIFFTPKGEVDDYITTLSGALAFADRSERLELLLSGRAVNQDYAEHDELDGLDQYYQGQIGYWLTPHLKAALEASFSKDSQPDRDIEVTGMVLGSATRDTQQYSARLQYDLNDITSGTLSYQYRDLTYDNSQYVDYRFHQAGLGFTRQLDTYFSNTTGRLNFNYAHYDYPATRLDYYAATVGFLYRLTELWHLQIDAGARYTASEFRFFDGRERNTGWGGVGVLAFGYQGEHAAAGLTISHDVGAASGQDGSVERTAALLDLNYRFGEKVKAGLSAGYYLNRADAGDLAPADTDEDTATLQPYLRADLIGGLSMELSYSDSQIKDNILDSTRERKVYLLKLSWNYPVLE